MKRVLSLAVLSILFTAQLSWAQIPALLNYQGVLKDTSSNTVPDGSYQLTLSFYDVATGGTALWTEIHPTVSTTQGIFNIILGSVTPLNLAFDKQYYLGITVDTDPEMSPRSQLTSAPYSLNTRTNPSACRAYTSVHSFAVPSGGVPTKLTFDTESYDLGNEYDPTNHRFTANESGIYSVKVMGHWLTNSEIYLYIYKNGAVLPAPASSWPPPAISPAHPYGFSTITTINAWIPIGYSMDVQLNANDYIEIFTESGGGGSINGYSLAIHKVQ